MSHHSYEVVHGVHRAQFDTGRVASSASSSLRATLGAPAPVTHGLRLAPELCIALQAKRRLSHDDGAHVDRFGGTRSDRFRSDLRQSIPITVSVTSVCIGETATHAPLARAVRAE